MRGSTEAMKHLEAWQSQHEAFGLPYQCNLDEIWAMDAALSYLAALEIPEDDQGFIVYFTLRYRIDDRRSEAYTVLYWWYEDLDEVILPAYYASRPCWPQE